MSELLPLFNINGNIYFFIKNFYFLFLSRTLYFIIQHCKTLSNLWHKTHVLLRVGLRATRQMDNRLTLSPSMLRIDVRHCVWVEHIEKPWGDKEGTREGRSASMKVTRPRRRDLFLLILAARERREEIYLIVRMFVGTKRQTGYQVRGQVEEAGHEKERDNASGGIRNPKYWQWIYTCIC